jgi:hypothetical protein
MDLEAEAEVALLADELLARLVFEHGVRRAWRRRGFALGRLIRRILSFRRWCARCLSLGSAKAPAGWQTFTGAEVGNLFDIPGPSGSWSTSWQPVLENRPQAFAETGSGYAEAVPARRRSWREGDDGPGEYR